MAFAAAAADIGLWQHNPHMEPFLGHRSLSRDAWPTKKIRRSPVNPSFRSSIPDDRVLVGETIVGIHDIEAPLEFRIIKPDGQVKWLQAIRAINRNAAGAVVNTSGVFTDISIRKAAEAEAELQRRELAHLMRVSQVGALSGGLHMTHTTADGDFGERPSSADHAFSQGTQIG